MNDCQKWFAVFHAADFSSHNVTYSGWPAEIPHNQIETLQEIMIIMHLLPEDNFFVFL